MTRSARRGTSRILEVSFHTEILCLTQISQITQIVFSDHEFHELHELEPVRSTGLDGDGAEDSGDDCGEDLQDLLKS